MVLVTVNEKVCNARPHLKVRKRRNYCYHLETIFTFLSPLSTFADYFKIRNFLYVNERFGLSVQ